MSRCPGCPGVWCLVSGSQQVLCLVSSSTTVYQVLLLYIRCHHEGWPTQQRSYRVVNPPDSNNRLPVQQFVEVYSMQYMQQLMLRACRRSPSRVLHKRALRFEMAHRGCDRFVPLDFSYYCCRTGGFPNTEQGIFGKHLLSRSREQAAFRKYHVRFYTLPVRLLSRKNY